MLWINLIINFLQSGIFADKTANFTHPANATARLGIRRLNTNIDNGLPNKINTMSLHPNIKKSYRLVEIAIV